MSPLPTSTAASGGSSSVATAAASPLPDAKRTGSCMQAAASATAAAHASRGLIRRLSPAVSSRRLRARWLERPQRMQRGTVQDLPADVEARAVTVAVEASLGRVPAQPAAHVRAPRIEYAQRAVAVPEGRGGLVLDAHDRALASPQRAGLAGRRLLDSLREPARRDRDVLAHERARAA